MAKNCKFRYLYVWASGWLCHIQGGCGEGNLLPMGGRGWWKVGGGGVWGDVGGHPYGLFKN